MSKIYTFYLLHGDDDLRIEEEAARLQAQFEDATNPGLNTSSFDGAATELGDILGAALAFPFLAERRLVVVKDLLAHLTRKGAGNTGKKALEMLIQQVPNLPDWTRLILVERQKIDERNKLLQLVRSHERAVEKLCSVPKDTTQWIAKRSQEVYATPIEPQAAHALATVTNGNLRAADSELAKLSLYVDGARPINEADVSLLTAYVSETTMFDMVDALAEGRTAAAASLLHKLLDQQEDPFAIYGMIIRQFRLLLLAKEHLTSGGSPQALSTVLGIHNYPAEKAGKQSRSFTILQLERIYRLLQEYDWKMKTGRIEPILALDLLVASLGK
jgi:DNA polymerase III subunit delta